MGPAAAAAAAATAALLAVVGAGLPPCWPRGRASGGWPCAESGAPGGQATTLALRGGGAGEQARDPGWAGGAGGRRRAKRGFTYPGTLWCGAGDIAENYEQLGEHRETDKCCREHDHCQHLIYPLTYKYGHRNLRLHTISHCDCDRRLKDCLSAVNDTASRVVGQAFFNLIRAPCFEFVYQEACVEPYLYVWCKNYSTMAVAVLQDPVTFSYGGELIDAPATRRPQPASSSTAVPRKGHFQPLESTTSPPPREPGQTGKRPPTLGPRAGPSSLPPKLRKGKGKGRGGWRGKGAQKQQKGPWGKAGPPAAPLHPAREGATIARKQLAAQELGKGDAQAPDRHPRVGQEDSPNAILSDEPGREGADLGAGAQHESTQTFLSKGTTTGPSRRRRRRRRKRRRKKLPHHQQHSMPNRDLEEEMLAG